MANDKKTLILGATTNTGRYAFRAAQMLTERGHTIVPVGIKKGEVFGKQISQDKEVIHESVHTVTLYVGPQNQPEWYDYILKQAPKRIVFNPGTENIELMRLAEEKGIEVVEGCTLVMLSIGNY
ncbi:CoA-binding protein [Algivirga pacifica]|uniref:CoA-binding protein n=1 Tax=Algivirga pacifica TaxID=1162670 RepID=A0ABP9D8T9_9BACT